MLDLIRRSARSIYSDIRKIINYLGRVAGILLQCSLQYINLLTNSTIWLINVDGLTMHYKKGSRLVFIREKIPQKIFKHH